MRNFGEGFIAGLIPFWGLLGTSIALRGNLESYEGNPISPDERAGYVIGALGQIAYWAALGVEIIKNLN